MTENNQELKMWLVCRTDIDMPRPKAMGQAGHGFSLCLVAAMNKNPNLVHEYNTNSCPKIVIGAKNIAALERAHRECVDAGLFVSPIIIDAARTHFTEPTATVFAVGPCYRNELPTFVQRAQLLKQ